MSLVNYAVIHPVDVEIFQCCSDNQRNWDSL